MQNVNIAELKNNLSHYLRLVKNGSEILIKDRNRVVARLVPVAPTADYDEELLALAAQGKVKLPEQPMNEAFIKEMQSAKLPRLKVKGKAARELLQRIMDEERDGR